MSCRIYMCFMKFVFISLWHNSEAWQAHGDREDWLLLVLSISHLRVYINTSLLPAAASGSLARSADSCSDRSGDASGCHVAAALAVLLFYSNWSHFHLFIFLAYLWFWWITPEIVVLNKSCLTSSCRNFQEMLMLIYFGDYLPIGAGAIISQPVPSVQVFPVNHSISLVK